MKHQVFSILDTKAGTYNPPFYQKNVGEATRTFSKICSDRESLISQYPEDFVLCLVGDFDDESGIISSIPVLTIGTAAQYVSKGSINA